MAAAPPPAAVAGAKAAAAAQAAGTAPKPENVVAAEEQAEDKACSTCCKTKKICFEPGPKIKNNRAKMKEFKRQLAAQERGINKMSPSKMIANREAFKDPLQRAELETISAASNAANRTAYRAAYNKFLRTVTPKVKPGHPAAMALQLAARETFIRGKIRSRMKNIASLHNPDKVAGGDAFQPISGKSIAKVLTGQNIDEIGDRAVNKSLGSLWSKKSASGNNRAGLLEKHLREQQKNGCPSPQVKLSVCKSKPGQPGEPA